MDICSTISYELRVIKNLIHILIDKEKEIVIEGNTDGFEYKVSISKEESS